MSVSKKTIICIPGLGGHESSMRGYAELLGGYDLKFLQLVNHEEAYARLLDMCERENSVTFLCNCYGAQLALRAIDEFPGKVQNLVVVEPFFAEFLGWRFPAMVVNKCIIALMRFTDRLGLRRRRFNYAIDYAKLAKYPIVFQPIFDMRWQNLTDYFLKLDDIATFRLPDKVTVPTLFIVSPKGYMRSAKDRNRLRSIFVRSTFVEISARTHNIITLAEGEIASAIRNWFEEGQTV